MSSDKVTLAQAAGQIGVHLNTIKTWRRSGYLKSAELIIEHGVEVWHVSLDEAIQVADSKRKTRGASNVYSRVYSADSLPGEAASNGPSPGGGVAGQLLARPEQAMLELITQTQKPLLEMIEKRDSTIQELSAKVGTLEEKLRAYEAAQGAQASRAGAGDSVAASVPYNASRPDSGPPAASPGAAGKVGFWRRLLGG